MPRLYRDLPVVHHYEVTFGTTLWSGVSYSRICSSSTCPLPPRPDCRSGSQPNCFSIDRGSGKAPSMLRRDGPLPHPTMTRRRAMPGVTSFMPAPRCSANKSGRRSSIDDASATGPSPWRPSDTATMSTSSTTSTTSLPRRGNWKDHWWRPSMRTPQVSVMEVATRGYLAELHRGAPDLALRLEPPLVAFLTEARQQLCSPVR